MFENVVDSKGKRHSMPAHRGHLGGDHRNLRHRHDVPSRPDPRALDAQAQLNPKEAAQGHLGSGRRKSRGRERISQNGHFGLGYDSGADFDARLSITRRNLDFGELGYQRPRDGNLQYRQLPELKSKRPIVAAASLPRSIWDSTGANVKPKASPWKLVAIGVVPSIAITCHRKDPPTTSSRRVPAGGRAGRRTGRGGSSEDGRFVGAGNRGNYYRRHHSDGYR